MLEHIVLLKLKEGVTEEQTQALMDALRDFIDQEIVPGFVDVTGGYNNSPEGLNRGYDFAFVLWFKDADARAAYLPHPEHKRLGKMYVGPIKDEILVFDYDHS